MVRLLLVFGLVAPCLALSDTFRCSTRGQVIYQDSPCSGGRVVDLGANAIPPDSFSRDQAEKRKADEVAKTRALSLKEDQERAELLKRRNAEDAEVIRLNNLRINCLAEHKALLDLDRNPAMHTSWKFRDYVIKRRKEHYQRCKGV